MLNKTLLKKEIKSNYKALLIFMAVLTLYSSMIVSMFDPKLGESLTMMMESMPGIFAAVGMSNPGSTLIEFLVNYLYGFLFIVFPLIFIIITSNKLVALYIDRGSMAYLLATPNKRRKIVSTQAFVLLLGILALTVYVTMLCIGASEAMFPGELDISKFILLNVGLYGLLVFLAGVCFCASCIFNDSKGAIGIGAGLAIAFLLIQMVFQVGKKFEFLKYFTPMTLFDADGIIAGEARAVGMFCILYAAGIVLFIIGIEVFCKRDISV